ncbi:MAG: hypothetical protein FJW14_09850 [Acidimicrobiia bacterium]|nr:hypothetical protein [Acidimicrobiia bacterium]
MAVARGLNIRVVDSLFDPDRPSDKVAQVRQRTSSRPLYRVFLYLEGPDLPFVQQVTYKLHETFSPDSVTVVRDISNPRCKFEIWTWGVFEVRAVIEDRQGRTFSTSRYLEYASQVGDPEVHFKKT